MSEITIDGKPVPFPVHSRYYASRGGLIPSLIVLHHTAGRWAGDLQTLLGNTDRKVSAHFLIDVDGRIQQLVKLERSAWHAGESAFNGHAVNGSVNPFSIGIEMSNLGQGEWPAKQVIACAKLVKVLLGLYNIPQDHVVGHKDICVPAGRKIDPYQFPWENFRRLLG